MIILSCMLLLISTVYAHRLNEYLQATTISLKKDKVELQVRLTAGTDIASQVIALIDADRNGLLSIAEQEKYVRSVLHDLFISIDGAIVVAHLQSWSFPTEEQMKNGLGDIQLNISAAINSNLASHRLTIQNKHFPSSAVYLVNCLLPADSTLQVTAQNRNLDQSVYTLDFTTKAVALKSQTENGDQWPVVKTYFFQGVKHILNGFDHLLFLCALVLGVASLWDLVKIVTAFTIAHSLTLTLATFGLVHLPSWVVEPLVAGSIVFVAVQNIIRPQDAGSRGRLAIAFFFGLFHGLGFAGGLLEVMHAMPVHTVVFALLGFSIGVEAGNQMVLLPLYGLLYSVKKIKVNHPNAPHPLLFKTASAMVAVAGMYYFVLAVTDIPCF